MKCSNPSCKNYDEVNGHHPCEDCRKTAVSHVVDTLADKGRIKRLKQWEKHKHNEQHPKKDE